jgi:hypothetical protein
MELVELARATWGDALQALSRECAGGAAHVSSSNLDGSLPSISPPYRPLQDLRYDEQRGGVEVSISLDRGAAPWLRCFVADPERICLLRWKEVRALLVFDGGGVRTLIQLATASDPHWKALATGDEEEDAGPGAVAGVGA